MASNHDRRDDAPAIFADASGAPAAVKDRRQSQASILTALLLVALATRLAFLLQIGDIGFFRHPVSDGAVFFEQAGAIVGGDLLMDPGFVHAPLYAYFLAAIRLIVGDSLWWIHVVQAVLGAGTCIILYAATARFFDRRVAVTAALLLALFGPALFYDALVQKTALASFLAGVLLWIMGGTLLGRRQVAMGVVFGLLCLTRQNALILAPLLWAWIVVRGSHRKVRRWVSPWPFAVGTVLVFLPWVVRNAVVTGELVLATPNLGQNFAMGNNAAATGTYMALDPAAPWQGVAGAEQREAVRIASAAAGRRLSPQEVSRYWLNEGWRFIRERPWSWIKLTWRKWLMTWGAYEIADVEDYYLYRTRSPLLAVLDRVFHFGVLVPLAGAGLVLTWRQRSSLWCLYGWLLLNALGVTVFVVLGRYRFILVMVLMMFAGAAPVELASAIRMRRWRTLTLAVASAAMCAAVVNRTVYRTRDVHAGAYANHAAVLLELGRYDEAAGESQKSLALNPNNPLAHVNYGTALARLGRLRQAERHYRTAVDINPRYAAACAGVGNALFLQQRFREAAQWYESALALEPDNVGVLVGLGKARRRDGRLAEAADALTRALALDPDHAEAAALLRLCNSEEDAASSSAG